MTKQPNQYTSMQELMKLWDKKLDRLDDEMLMYIVQRANNLIEYRTEKLIKENQ